MRIINAWGKAGFRGVFRDCKIVVFGAFCSNLDISNLTLAKVIAVIKIILKVKFSVLN